jgi:hypothetical protein
MRAHFAYVLLLVCSSGAACELPALPAIPEDVGDDVARVLIDVRRYADSMIEYTACLRTELAAAGGDTAPLFQRSALILRNNHAVEEHKAVIDLYAKRVGPLENLRLAEYVGADSRDCLLGSAIMKTGVVNGSAVIFFSFNKKAYLNLLKATCPELEHEGAFLVGISRSNGNGTNPAMRGAISPNGVGPMVQTQLVRRVCEQDRIFPGREDFAHRVIGCALGRFFALSEEQALQIIARRGEQTSEQAK